MFRRGDAVYKYTPSVFFHGFVCGSFNLVFGDQSCEYYVIQSRGGNIFISKSEDLRHAKIPQTLVPSKY